MNKHDVLAKIREVGLVPVIRAESPEAAGRAIDAIRAGGVPILEITMTVPGAVGLIEDMARKYGKDAVVGAGTVLDPETARACILAGAPFVGRRSEEHTSELPSPPYPLCRLLLGKK